MRPGRVPALATNGDTKPIFGAHKRAWTNLEGTYGEGDGAEWEGDAFASDGVGDVDGEGTGDTSDVAAGTGTFDTPPPESSATTVAGYFADFAAATPS